MAKKYYKGKSRNYRLLLRLGSIVTVVFGAILFAYTFFPLISWQVYFAPVFASQKIAAPIPNGSVINSSNIEDLIASAATSVGADYTNAYNWYPGLSRRTNIKANYKLSIPKLGIKDSIVSNEDNDLTRHLVQFNADSIPPEKGNSVIFGHSTLPQLFDSKNYKTIFATVYKLKVGDEILIEAENVKYLYEIENITVVEPEDTSVLAQNYSDSFLTLITCTPPGTIWKRLIIKARLEKI